MSFHRTPDPAPDAGAAGEGQARAYDTGFMTSYLDTLMLVERLHRLLSENDQDLYQWVSGQVAPPDRYARLVARIAEGAAGVTRPS